ncbi:MAG TPA: 50S ribosomal protein L35 [candidate division WOR-3 bacterium]|uniref:50S ribosomal protein L35 n=1 Tax=candidate division WOR-3 bacterium TaxID=2052148 RepID=A0A7V0XF59_UNCW3|nr:50S ribosomal protein L35 [candidate division WOR-3 bacterium]
MKNKLKTLSSLKRRVRRTGTGKFKFHSGGTNHNNGCKSKAQKRRLHAPKIASKGVAARLKQLAPKGRGI